MDTFNTVLCQFQSKHLSVNNNNMFLFQYLQLFQDKQSQSDHIKQTRKQIKLQNQNDLNMNQSPQTRSQSKPQKRIRRQPKFHTSNWK